MKSSSMMETNLLAEMLRSRMQRLDAALARAQRADSAETADAEWEDVIFAAAEMTTAFRALVRSRGGSARDRMLRYLKSHVGEVVDGDVLASLAGISEWARRLRELDVDFGYDLVTNDTDPSLRPSQYRLGSPEPDSERTEWRRLKKRLRVDSSIDPAEKVASLLLNRVGRSVKYTELSQVVEPADPAVLVEELRQRLGLEISTRLTRPDLPPDSCLLEHSDPIPQLDRVSNDCYRSVLKRDGYVCRKCGMGILHLDEDRGKYLTVRRRSGVTIPYGPEDFETRCSRCV